MVLPTETTQVVGGRARPDAGPVLPDYGGACITEVVPALLRQVGLDPGPGRGALPEALLEPLLQARQVVLFVLDGLGWEQLATRREIAPTLAAMAGGPITSVAPSTTATAMTSIALGRTPAEHGIVGYRVRVGDDEVLNVLHWRTALGDARSVHLPEELQPSLAFDGHPVPAVTRAVFAETGFTAAFLRGSRQVGWRAPSSIPLEVARLLGDGEPLVFAYYDLIDTVAHVHGLGRHYDAELAAADRLVGEVVSVLPPGAALVVTADHGQVQVDREPVQLPPELVGELTMLSGEGRFRWLHTRPGATAEVAAAAEAALGELAWVRTRRQVIDENWLGGDPVPEIAARLGDVAVVARAPVAFADPADTGSFELVCRHGSLTAAEMLVPLLAISG